MFIVNQLYPRDELMKFAGSNERQTGILYAKGVDPNNQEYVVITSGGRHGKKSGYHDYENADGTWVYYGQGGKGDHDPKSRANRMLLESSGTKLLFTTREPTSDEVKQRGHYGKLYRFKGAFKLEGWRIELIKSGKRKGDKLINATLAPIGQIPHVAESISTLKEKPKSTKPRHQGTPSTTGLRAYLSVFHSTSEIAASNTPSEEQLDKLASSLDKNGYFNTDSMEDVRVKTLCEIAIRRGQPGFRKALLLAYGCRCAVSGYDCEEALEAAHISPYLGEKSQEVRNGLLLRADIHTLFDRGLIAIETKTMRVRLADALLGSNYKYLQGKDVQLPSDKRFYPDLDALDMHFNWVFGGE